MPLFGKKKTDDYEVEDMSSEVKPMTKPGVPASEEAQLPRFVMHPDTQGRQIFDIIVSIILVYAILVTPFRVCFGVDATLFFFVLETGMDVIFGIDLFVNFRTAIHTEDYGLISDPKQIAKMYLKGWFWVDFFSAFPLDVIVLSATQSGEANDAYKVPKAFRMIKLVRLVRLLRVFRLSRIYRKWQVKIQVNSGVFRLVKIFIMVVVLAHLSACFWFYMAVLQLDTKGVVTWLDHTNLKDVPVSEQYVAAFYWAIMTITTVGYGDIVGMNTLERMFLIMAMIVGVTMFSYAVGSMSFLVQRMESNPIHERMDAVNEYMRFRKLPKLMQIDIRQHYLIAWGRHQAALNEKVVMEELSQRLRENVAMFLHQQVLGDNPLLSGMSKEFITDIILRLQPQAAGPGDIIIKEGSYGQEMYMLNRGTVEVCDLANGLHYATLEERSYFGEIALLEECKRTASVRAISHCQLDVLTRNDFKDVLELHPGAADKLELYQTANARKKEVEAAKKGTTSDVDVLSPRTVGERKEKERLTQRGVPLKSPRRNSRATSSDVDYEYVNHKRRMLACLSSNPGSYKIFELASNARFDDLVAVLAQRLASKASLIDKIELLMRSPSGETSTINIEDDHDVGPLRADDFLLVSLSDDLINGMKKPPSAHVPRPSVPPPIPKKPTVCLSTRSTR